MKTKYLWALSGALQDENGRDLLPLPIGGFYIRRGPARVSQTEIRWKRISEAEALRAGAVPVPYNLGTFALLRDFLALADGTKEEFRRFAQRYGPLSGIHPLGGERESLIDWCRCIEIVNGILSIATKLQNGKLADEKDWASLPGERSYSGPPIPHALTLSLQKFRLSQTIQELVLKWAVWPQVSFADSGVHLQLGGPRLLSGIGAQLLCAVCKTDSFILCSNCGRTYAPERKPRAGNHFCQQCRGKGAKGKFAQQKYRRMHLRSKRKETTR